MLWLIDYSPIGIAGLLKVSNGVNILDFETRHTADFACPWLDSMGQAGRTFHLTRVMPLGILFPPSFMLFMFCWLSLLLQKTTKSNSKFCLIALLPPVYMLLDWTENIEITAMLMNFPERLNKICVATGIITSVKKVVLLVIISYIILLAALLIKRNGGKIMPRLKDNTKEIILEKSLKLFAVHGYEAVSIRQIADEVGIGIGNSALYKHYESKQAIFDALVNKLKQRYLKQCSSVNSNIQGVEAVKENCLKMFEYQTQNEWIVNFRQLLLIEKFKNPKMAELYKEFFVDIPLNTQKEIFIELQNQGLMTGGDPYVFAMELYAPFYLFHFVEHDYSELIEKYRTHAEYFFDAHFIRENKSNNLKEIKQVPRICQ